MRLWTFLLLLVSMTSLGQTGPINIHMKSGEIISTNYAYLYTYYGSRRPYVQIHEKKGEKIPIDDVDHVEGTDKYGRYRYFKPISPGGKLIWGERSYTSARIEIYHTDVVDGTMNSKLKYKAGYYSKDNGPLTSIKLKYLKRDLADSPESMIHVKKGKTLGAVQGVIYVAAYTLIIVGIVDVVDNAGNKPLPPPGATSASIPAPIIAGAVLAWVPLAFSEPKHDHYINALRAYK